MIKMIHGDCLEYMKTMTDKIDVVITDPPYGVKKTSWDDSFPEIAYWKNLYEIMSDNSNIILFTGEKDLPLKVSILSSIFIYQWVIVWYKPNAMQFGKTGFSKHNLIYWFSKGKGIIKNKSIDVIVDSMGKNINKIEHASPKNIDVIKKLVEMFSKEGGIIFDPFTGSGTTGIACHNLNRNFIGIEKEKKYYDIAVKRIEDAGGNVIQQRL